MCWQNFFISKLIGIVIKCKSYKSKYEKESTLTIATKNYFLSGYWSIHLLIHCAVSSYKKEIEDTVKN